MSCQSRNTFQPRAQAGYQTRLVPVQLAQPTTALYDVQVPDTGLNVRVNVSPYQLDGICLGRYLLFGGDANNRIRIYSVAGQRQSLCNAQHMQNHILLQDEDALDFEPETAGPEFQGQKLAKVDLETAVYIINYENEQFLQGLSQAFIWAGLKPDDYLFPY